MAQNGVIQASAPGKIILFGEHAVVYGRPAIAVPVAQVQATATLMPGRPGRGLILDLSDLAEQIALVDAPADHALAHVARLALEQVGLTSPPDWRVSIHSTIPLASGLGSGAAVATALVRALGQAAGRPFSPAEVSALVYESEKHFHGTPSGIDNTVVAFQQPVWFVKDHSPQPFAIGRPFTIIIADTGIASPTWETVADVRNGWLAQPARFEALFDAIGQIVQAARQAIEEGNVAALGPLMNQNHALLRDLGVSSPLLDRLQAVATGAGALGAKLSGGGRGGNLIVLATGATASIRSALAAYGAVRTLVTDVG